MLKRICMKRLAYSILLASLAFCLAGCGQKKEPVFERKVSLGSHSAVKAEPREPNSPISIYFRLSWWGPRHDAIVQRVKQGNVDLIMLGDSITHWWETTGKETWNTFYAGRKAVDMGYACDGTQQLLWRIENGEIGGISPKLAVVLIGTNNSGSNSADQIADGIAAILQKLRTDLPRTKILLLAIFPRGDQPAQMPVINQTNEIIKTFADNRHIFFLDINNIWLNPDGSVNKNFMPDKLHPNAAGYKMWAQTIEPVIKKLMK